MLLVLSLKQIYGGESGGRYTTHHLPITMTPPTHYLASYPAFPQIFITRSIKIPPPIFHTASDKNLGVGKAVYKAR